MKKGKKIKTERVKDFSLQLETIYQGPDTCKGGPFG